MHATRLAKVLFVIVYEIKISERQRLIKFTSKYDV